MRMQPRGQRQPGSLSDPATSHISNGRRFSVLFLLGFWMSMAQTCQATITVVDSGHKYASRQNLKLADDNQTYQRMWKGYEYKARLQYVDGNLPLCPDPRNPDQKYNLTAPRDGGSVALLVRQDGGCSLEQKIQFALHNLEPRHLVQYLIIDGYDSQEAGKELEEEEVMEEALVKLIRSSNMESEEDKEYEAYDDDLMEDWIRKHHLPSKDKKDVVPLCK